MTLKIGFLKVKQTSRKATTSGSAKANCVNCGGLFVIMKIKKEPKAG